jgi:hypothetical protein
MSSIESILHTISWKQRTVVFLFIYEGKEGLAVFFIYFYGDGLGNTLGLFLFVGSLVLSFGLKLLMWAKTFIFDYILEN